jgi:hypothetical protein
MTTAYLDCFNRFWEPAARAAPWGRLDVHPRVAMQILRHSKIAITMEIYTEVVSSATRDALRKLGAQLGP